MDSEELSALEVSQMINKNFKHTAGNKLKSEVLKCVMIE